MNEESELDSTCGVSDKEKRLVVSGKRYGKEVLRLFG